ncbi:holin, phage phi LC3 family [Pseudoramibacter alactolyticus ATCC 23263]|jgi:phi LC3 family holin|uniref:Holin, phage phi LC3 family n=1 Tax=Pseudoramibacter alactolyticus ATCC 23263 TaxID=887929 RepID=E6MGW7_9FIRM|nr:phage holin [Pseudoramibacter alactolyticus]EFV01857.1 holin, phage phi LC3 family [Pseudoramibacter alactolyticus ATCC 23263]
MKKINWKLRLKNKTALAAIVAAAVTFIYQILGIIGVVPAIAQNDVIQGLGIALNLLATLGIITDPTTEGAGDSTQALGYDYPSPTAPTGKATEQEGE